MNTLELIEKIQRPGIITFIDAGNSQIILRGVVSILYPKHAVGFAAEDGDIKIVEQPKYELTEHGSIRVIDKATDEFVFYLHPMEMKPALNGGDE